MSGWVGRKKRTNTVISWLTYHFMVLFGPCMMAELWKDAQDRSSSNI